MKSSDRSQNRGVDPLRGNTLFGQVHSRASYNIAIRETSFRMTLIDIRYNGTEMIASFTSGFGGFLDMLQCDLDTGRLN
jgi:hypothetical protein